MNPKERISHYIDGQQQALWDMADAIFDKPELGNQEVFASGLLTDALKQRGFQVTLGLGTLPTAFKATYQQGTGGPNIGLLCEYDALPMGHACGHHLQGPAIIAAADAVKHALPEGSYTLTVYGTPAEEGGAGKLVMLKDGFLQDIDVALMLHGGPATQIDVKSMAMQGVKVTFHGKSSHAALKPEAGRSALDALLLSFQAVEFLREHVKEDTRMHYTVLDAGGPENIVPQKAVGKFVLRSYNTDYLKEVVARFKNIVKGAALMTDTTYDLDDNPMMGRDGKVPVHLLNALIMDNAGFYGAPNIKPAREKTGSTDFGNVTYLKPGTCLRIAFVDEGTSSHSQEFLDAGKTRRGHDAITMGAKVLAATAVDLILSPDKLSAIQREFADTKEKMKQGRA